MEAKYAITELNNGWILLDDDGEFYYQTFSELLKVLASKEQLRINALGK